jgi:hypothetical protein
MRRSTSNGIVSHRLKVYFWAMSSEFLKEQSSGLWCFPWHQLLLNLVAPSPLGRVIHAGTELLGAPTTIWFLVCSEISAACGGNHNIDSEGPEELGGLQEHRGWLAPPEDHSGPGGCPGRLVAVPWVECQRLRGHALLETLHRRSHPAGHLTSVLRCLLGNTARVIYASFFSSHPPSRPG